MISFAARIKNSIKSIFYDEHNYKGKLSREDYWAHYAAIAIVIGIPLIFIYLLSLIIPEYISKWLYLIILPIALKCTEANYAANYKRYNDIKSPGKKMEISALVLFVFGAVSLLLGLNKDYQLFSFLGLVFAMMGMMGIFLITYIKSFFVAGEK